MTFSPIRAAAYTAIASLTLLAGVIRVRTALAVDAPSKPAAAAAAPNAPPPAPKATSAPATQQDFSPKPPIPMLSPADELKTFQLPPGYHMELVLAEPDIREPVVCVFDGNGR